jgi:universal stress protein family protein
MFRKILHANDGSDHAFNALSLALQIAKHDNAELHMVSVEQVDHMPELVEEARQDTATAARRFHNVLQRARAMAEENHPNSPQSARLCYLALRRQGQNGSLADDLALDPFSLFVKTMCGAAANADDDLRTVPLLDHHHAARHGRGRGEYHKVRSNPMRYGQCNSIVAALINDVAGLRKSLAEELQHTLPFPTTYC